MSFMRLAACTTVLAALSAGAVSAEPALVTTNVNLRQGPGTTYQITTTIPGGSTVEAASCTSQWCQVTWQGQNGYVISTSLDSGNGAPGGAGGPSAPSGPGGPAAAAPPGGPVGGVPGDDIPVPAYGGPPPPAYVGPPAFYGYGPYYGPYGGGGYYRGYGYGYRGYGYGYRRW